MLKLDTNSVAQATEILVKDKTLSLTQEFTTLGFSESAIKDALAVLVPPLTNSISAILGGETSSLEVTKTTETKPKTPKNSKGKKTKAETVSEEPAPEPVQTVAPEPVQTVAPAPVQTVAPVPEPVQTVTPVPEPVQTVTPVPEPVQTPAPAQRAESLFELGSNNVNMDLEL